MKKKSVYIITLCPFCGSDFNMSDFLRLSFKAKCSNPECGMTMRSSEGYGDLVNRINRRAKG